MTDLKRSTASSAARLYIMYLDAYSKLSADIWFARNDTYMDSGAQLGHRDVLGELFDHNT
jgi:hypothetical protein